MSFKRNIETIDAVGRELHNAHVLAVDMLFRAIKATPAVLRRVIGKALGNSPPEIDYDCPQSGPWVPFDPSDQRHGADS